MHKKYDLVATIGKYKNADGEEKKRYANVGSVFEDSEGRISIKLDTVPCAPEWSGWLSCYAPKGDREQPNRHSQSQHEKAKTNAYQPEDDDDSSIPF